MLTISNFSESRSTRPDSELGKDHVPTIFHSTVPFIDCSRQVVGHQVNALKNRQNIGQRSVSACNWEGPNGVDEEQNWVQADHGGYEDTRDLVLRILNICPSFQSYSNEDSTWIVESLGDMFQH